MLLNSQDYGRWQLRRAEETHRSLQGWRDAAVLQSNSQWLLACSLRKIIPSVTKTIVRELKRTKGFILADSS